MSAPCQFLAHDSKGSSDGIPNGQTCISSLLLKVSTNQSDKSMYTNNKEQLKSYYMSNKDYPGNKSFTISLTDLRYFSMRF